MIQSPRPANQPDTTISTASRRSATQPSRNPQHAATAVLCYCTRLSGTAHLSEKTPDLGGATGIRTPDLLHAMEHRSVHQSPRQATSDPAELLIRPEEVTSVHQSSPRTVTNLVTSQNRHHPENRNNIRILGSRRASPLLYQAWHADAPGAIATQPANPPTPHPPRRPAPTGSLPATTPPAPTGRQRTPGTGRRTLSAHPTAGRSPGRPQAAGTTSQRRHPQPARGAMLPADPPAPTRHSAARHSAATPSPRPARRPA